MLWFKYRIVTILSLLSYFQSVPEHGVWPADTLCDKQDILILLNWGPVNVLHSNYQELMGDSVSLQR